MWRTGCYVLVLLCLYKEIVTADRVNYKGYQVYRVRINDLDDADAIKGLREFDGYDFWTSIDMKNRRVDIMVSPKNLAEFERFLEKHHLSAYVTIDDLGLMMRRAHKTDSLRMPGADVSRYMDYDEIINHVRHLATVPNPNTGEPILKMEVVGRTYEGRDVYLTRISSDFSKNKPIFMMDAGMHAREWAGPPTVLYFMTQLVENFTSNADLLQNFDFYIVPLTNPDGYQYTRSHDRMWRKTRSPQGVCDGVDGNRNFDFFWGLTGTSSDPCSDTFKGPFPFSEYEPRNIRNIGEVYKDRILGYVAVHSYGGFLLYPWGYTQELASDWVNMDTCAAAYVDKIQSFSGTKYTYGPSSRVMYEAAGGADDFFHGVLHIPFTYTLELPATKEEGFHLMESKLHDVGVETFEGLRSLVFCIDYLVSKFPILKKK